MQLKFSKLCNIIKRFAKNMLEKLQALYIASKDRRTKWWVKILIAAVLGYALSPIDLIPDFIPVLGYVDDIILVPLGIYYITKLIPIGLWQEYIAIAQQSKAVLPPSRKAAVVIGITWLSALVVISNYLWY
jgi:uncharacterized membrane protein YkvA (DUF1232 family)|tara:strand:- start:2827 stop:3219 length:393 start_codon:yes stop_codon:yes gene_type:complete